MYDYLDRAAEDSSLSNRNGPGADRMGGTLALGNGYGGMDNMEAEHRRPLAAVRSLRAAGADYDDRIVRDSGMEAVRAVACADLNSSLLGLVFLLPALLLVR